MQTRVTAVADLGDGMVRDPHPGKSEYEVDMRFPPSSIDPRRSWPLIWFRHPLCIRWYSKYSNPLRRREIGARAASPGCAKAVPNGPPKSLAYRVGFGPMETIDLCALR